MNVAHNAKTDEMEKMKVEKKYNNFGGLTSWTKPPGGR